MNKECGIIKDLLPLYAENIASPETVEFVEEHLKACEDCRKEYERIKAPDVIEPSLIQADMSAAPLLELKRKMRIKRIQTVAVTAMIAIVLLASLFAFLSTPDYIPYSDNPVTVTVDDRNEEVLVSFSKDVKAYYFDSFHETDDSGHEYYYISAYTSIWYNWFANWIAGPLVLTDDPSSVTLYYASNNGKEDVCIYGEPLEGVDGTTSLPRLALGYYLMISVALFGFLLAACIIFRKKENIRIWIERIMFYPLSYAIAHLLVLGFSFVTYSMIRDLLLIIFISLLLWCGMLFAHSALKNRREIKEISQAIEKQE